MGNILKILIGLLIVVVGFWGLKKAWDGYLAIPGEIDKRVDQIESSPAFENPEDLENWQEFVSTQGNFKVLFPTLPQNAKEDLKVADSDVVLKYNMYASEDQRGATLMVSLVVYPDSVDLSEPESVLENVMNEMMKTNPNNKLISMEHSEYNGFKSIDFAIANPELHIKSRAFVANQTLYLLAMLDKADQFSDKEYEHFINSFKLTLQKEAVPAK